MAPLVASLRCGALVHCDGVARIAFTDVLPHPRDADAGKRMGNARNKRSAQGERRADDYACATEHGCPFKEVQREGIKAHAAERDITVAPLLNAVVSSLQR